MQVFREIEASNCPLRTGAYQPGCSTVAVNPFEQPRMAGPLIKSDSQGATEICTSPQISHIQANFSSPACRVLHNYCVAVVPVAPASVHVTWPAHVRHFSPLEKLKLCVLASRSNSGRHLLVVPPGDPLAEHASKWSELSIDGGSGFWAARGDLQALEHELSKLSKTSRSYSRHRSLTLPTPYRTRPRPALTHMMTFGRG